jgi:hypothetical protein
MQRGSKIEYNHFSGKKNVNGRAAFGRGLIW